MSYISDPWLQEQKERLNLMKINSEPDRSPMPL